MLAKSSCTSSAVCFLLDLTSPDAESVDSMDESRWWAKLFMTSETVSDFNAPYPSAVPALFLGKICHCGCHISMPPPWTGVGVERRRAEDDGVVLEGASGQAAAAAVERSEP